MHKDKYDKKSSKVKRIKKRMRSKKTTFLRKETERIFVINLIPCTGILVH